MKLGLTLLLLAAIASADVTPVSVAPSSLGPSHFPATCGVVTSTTASVSPQWTSKFIYPIEVCASIKGEVAPCPGDKKVSLDMMKGGKKVASLDATFILEKNTDLYCFTFKPCDILDTLRAVTPAVRLEEIQVVGTVTVAGVAAAAARGERDYCISLLRAVGIAVSSKETVLYTYESNLSANYAVVRQGTFCEDYECFNRVEGATAEMTTTTQKMILIKDASLPTCEFDGNAEGTKLHMTVLAKKEGPCSIAGYDPDCKGRVVILDRDFPGGSASSTVVGTSSTLAVVSTLTVTTLVAMTT